MNVDAASFAGPLKRYECESALLLAVMRARPRQRPPPGAPNVRIMMRVQLARGAGWRERERHQNKRLDRSTEAEIRRLSVFAPYELTFMAA